AASFDREGKLLYLKKQGDRTEIAVRSLDDVLRVEISSGTELMFDELSFDPGKGRLLRAELDEGGARHVQTGTHQTESGDNQHDRPAPRTPRRCQPRSSSSPAGDDGGATETRLLYIYADGPRSPVTYPDLLWPLGTSILRRPRTGELLLTTNKGETKELV